MKIPKSLKDIKLKQLEQIADIDIENEKDRRLNEIAILCNITIDELYYSTNIETITNSINELKWFYDLKSEDIVDCFEFTYNGIEYELIQEMNELTFGQWMDLDYYIQTHQANYWTLTKHIIALCSSIKNEKHSYPSTSKELSKRVLIIEDLPLDIIYGYTNYFLKKKMKWNNLQDLIMYLELSSQNQNGQTTMKSITQSMDGQHMLGHFLAKMLLNLMMFLGWVYMTVYLPLVSLTQKIKLNLKLIKL